MYVAMKRSNVLWPSSTVWCQLTESALVQAMAYRRSVPSQYMNQWWLISDYTVKPVCNDHLYNKVYYLWLIQ